MSEESEKKWLALRHEANALRLATAISSLNERSVEPVLIKGYAASLFYPEPPQRAYSDVDLCVAPSDFDKVRHLLRELDLGVGIDLHYGFRHLHPSEFASVYKRTLTIDVAGTPVRVPSAEDHLVILSTHWLNDGGARKERLDDIKNLIEYNNDLDWGYLRTILPPHRWRWLAITISAASEYRGLATDSLPLGAEDLRIPAWVRLALDKEWKQERLEPLYYAKREPSLFFRQIRRRFPPNPIESVVECDGDFDSGRVSLYQTVSFLRRIPRAVYLQLVVRS